MPHESDKDSARCLLETAVFRPLYAMRRLGFPNGVESGKLTSAKLLTEQDITHTSSMYGKLIWKRLKELCDNEIMDFEKWLTMQGMKMTFFSQALLDLVFRMGAVKRNQRNSLAININQGMMKQVGKSMFSGAVMAINVGCIITSVTHFAAWRERFSLWTVPCAATVIPAAFSYSLGMTPLQAMRGGFMLGIWISLTILSASEYYDITVDETYKLFKNDCEIKLIEERNSALHKFMKEHHIYSKWFGKWMMNKYQRRDEELGKLSNNIIDDVL